MKNLSSNPAELDEIVELVSKHSKVLLATDFDGTISNFTNNPKDATLDHIARVALRKLSELPNTYVAVISGRALSDLTDKFQQLERVRLIGSHGHEFDIDRLAPITTEQQELLQKAENIVRNVVDRFPGTHIEIKPHGVVFHFREFPAISADELNALKADLQKLNGGILHDGKMVLEFCIVTTDKGQALNRILEQVVPTITIFIGDDWTDEAGFKQLGASDISIKVGTGTTSARYQIHSSTEVIDFLVKIAEQRSLWMKQFPACPIDRHLFLSDLRTAALVDQDGTVNWLCAPRLDGIPLFGALVGGPGAGYFRIHGAGPSVQTYLGNTLIGKTTFGNISVTDFLDCSAGRNFKRAGRSDFIRRIEGTGEFLVEFAPKFNFGRVPTRLVAIEQGLRIECGKQKFVLVSPGFDWEIKLEGLHDVARSRVSLNNSQKHLILMIGASSITSTLRSVKYMLSETQLFWDNWLSTLSLPKCYTDIAARSAIVLRGLCYDSTGAIAAASTTSLPEIMGGVRNWDYRYCWPRDASWTASALMRLNAIDPAMRLLNWISKSVFDFDNEYFISPLYTLSGEPVIAEAEITEAQGYQASRPVRVGNIAAAQLQLDALGPIAELIWQLAKNSAPLSESHYRLVERIVKMIQTHWNEKDSGIWEVRGIQRHYVYSKLMCWYAITCSLKISDYFNIERNDWVKLADEIREQIETQGYDNRLQSYIAAYDLAQADSALLWIILSGFHPPQHQRCQGTLKYIMKHLVHEGSVYRYNFDDSLHGQEGEFILCRCWLIEAMIMIGDLVEAKRLFDEFRSRISPLGLLTEQWNSKENFALGNYPQAYSHLGLINVICRFEQSLN